MKLRKIVIFLVLTSFAMAYTSCVLRATLKQTNIDEEASLADPIITAKFNEIWEHVVLSHISGVKNTKEAKLKCALDMLSGGLSKCLDDPFSKYYTTEDWADYEAQSNGVYEGVGLDLIDHQNRVVIVSSIRGTPAGNSCAFVSGDVVEKIDGKDVGEESITSVARKISGPNGSKVSIVVRRDGELMEEVMLTRAKIIVRAIETEEISSDIFYIKGNQFTPRFFEEFYSAFSLTVEYSPNRIFPDKPQRKVIIDLRDNPGGLLNAVEFVSYLFATNPEDIVVTLRKKDSEITTKAGDIIKRINEIKPNMEIPPGTFARTSIVVLINNGTASASEILAGLLHDWLNVPLVGTKTFGKGSVQIIPPLNDNDGMRLTEAEYFVGNGKIKINKKGLIPDYWVDNPAQKRRDPFLGPPPLIDLEHDEQLKKAVEILHNK